jgi:hypothetical protein
MHDQQVLFKNNGQEDYLNFELLMVVLQTIFVVFFPWDWDLN